MDRILFGRINIPIAFKVPLPFDYFSAWRRETGGSVGGERVGIGERRGGAHLAELVGRGTLAPEERRNWRCTKRSALGVPDPFGIDLDGRCVAASPEGLRLS